MRIYAFPCPCLLFRIRFCNVSHLRNVCALKAFSHTEWLHVCSDSCSLQRSLYYNLDSNYTRICPSTWRTYVFKRLFSSPANSDEKLQALKKRKEAKRLERLGRQRTNELKRNVSIFVCMYVRPYSCIVFDLVFLWTNCMQTQIVLCVYHYIFFCYRVPLVLNCKLNNYAKNVDDILDHWLCFVLYCGVVFFFMHQREAI